MAVGTAIFELPYVKVCGLVEKYADWGKVCGFALKQVQNQKANPHTMRIGKVVMIALG